MSLPPLVIANPAARRGRTRGEIEAIVTALQARIGAVDLALPERVGHATDLAARAVTERRRLVIAVGGDGVLSEVVNGVLRAAESPSCDFPPSETPTAGGRDNGETTARDPTATAGGPPSAASGSTTTSR